MSAVINIIIAFPSIKAGCDSSEKKLFWDNKNIFACLRFKPFQLNKALKWPSPPVVLAATFLLLQLPLLLLFASASVIVFILCLFVACAPMCARSGPGKQNAY